MANHRSILAFLSILGSTVFVAHCGSDDTALTAGSTTPDASAGTGGGTSTGGSPETGGANTGGAATGGSNSGGSGGSTEGGPLPRADRKIVCSNVCVNPDTSAELR
jgi:hypothetical protein